MLELNVPVIVNVIPPGPQVPEYVNELFVILLSRPVVVLSASVVQPGPLKDPAILRLVMISAAIVKEIAFPWLVVPLQLPLKSRPLQ